MLNDCNTNMLPRHYDLFGFEKTRPTKQFCHQKLNRCVDDPTSVTNDKLPGEKCTLGWECRSQQCVNLIKIVGDHQEKLGFRCKGAASDQACTGDEDCNIGLFCDAQGSGTCKP
mmetsp:Transcript_38422/g.58505  ORF Transcript_38422/g.58505 Transcript_38422/m.58505 type:complete len:114 (+) Transcript_38422:222-563(+)